MVIPTLSAGGQILKSKFTNCDRGGPWRTDLHGNMAIQRLTQRLSRTLSPEVPFDGAIRDSGRKPARFMGSVAAAAIKCRAEICLSRCSAVQLWRRKNAARDFRVVWT
ncbi:hypothetical protein ACJJTC_000514 [Scirpophaga incertulas]